MTTLHHWDTDSRPKYQGRPRLSKASRNIQVVVLGPPPPYGWLGSPQQPAPAGEVGEEDEAGHINPGTEQGETGNGPPPRDVARHEGWARQRAGLVS